ncbi:glycosyltransferase involved in cell wall biosynthesis [Rhodoblastus acidophilus]|uniref:glycosyltransferase family 2 protein n=1 Tax=Rhodoblastus acidophilus TaxID=1074 RepID=UPI0022253508|nr:glycosyltransferase family 2 protein [Rhodoblastus acidophilus]MCW2283766.1 glycosyltransferase involved in cell wall biosynthesis [Rhodoblastus acidophilus]MCW2332885.1 glycosyltransferase involved in cell wall biosynthesis [Rhodoblastus acidophilus]
MKTLSLVTPCYNEEAGIAECYEACRNIMSELPGYAYEHVFIDNCSGDRTVAILKEIAARDKRVKIIVNARNFGHARSPHHAMLQVDGDAVIPVLADLQTPPALIPEMVRAWEEGYKVVVAVRENAGAGSPPVALARKLFYSLIRKISNVEQIPNYIGYGLYDRRVMDVMRTLYEPDPYFRGLVPEIGFERKVVAYHQPERKHGTSRHSIFDLVDYALTGITTFSKAPMRLMTVVGFVAACLSFAFGFLYLIAKLLFWSSIPFGVAPILIAVFMLGSIQLLALGLLGEYVGVLLQYARRFPLVVEKERVNFD